MKGFLYGGLTDVGWKRELNEDYIGIEELGEDAVFAAIADGAGSKNGNMLQPAAIAIQEVIKVIRRIYAEDKNCLKDHAEMIIRETMMTANRVLSAFKVANEELYAGFGCTFTSIIVFSDRFAVFGHIGNDQLILMRESKTKDTYIPKILTKEMTRARKQFDEGIIRPEQFETHPDRMIITDALGLTTDPNIQIFSMTLKDNDFIIMTTDGIHYAVRPEAIGQIVLESNNCDAAVRNLVDSAKTQNYSDNMSAIVLFNIGSGQTDENKEGDG